jgi:hypothetical protein
MIGLRLFHDDACVESFQVQDSRVEGAAFANKVSVIRAILQCLLGEGGLPRGRLTLGWLHIPSINGGVFQITQKLMVTRRLNIQKHHTHISRVCLKVSRESLKSHGLHCLDIILNGGLTNKALKIVRSLRSR